MKKIKKAAAIRYEMGEKAPTITAKGKGTVAEKIMEKAEEESIPIYKNEKLADTLTQFDIGTYIPEELYEVVAEILVFIDRLDQNKMEN